MQCAKQEKSFPRELQNSARRLARNVAAKTAEEFILQAGAKVKKLQERVELIDDYFKDLAEGDGVRTWLGRAIDILMNVD